MLSPRKPPTISIEAYENIESAHFRNSQNSITEDIGIDFRKSPKPNIVTNINDYSEHQRYSSLSLDFYRVS